MSRLIEMFWNGFARMCVIAIVAVIATACAKSPAPYWGSLAGGVQQTQQKAP